MLPAHKFDSVFEGLLEPLQSGDLALTIGDASYPDVPLIRANAAFCALTGYSESEVIGRSCNFLRGPRTAPARVARLRHAIKEGVSTRVELWNYRRDGTPFLNEVILNPVRDFTGRLRYITGIQRDVTARAVETAHRIRFALLPDATLLSLDHPTGLGQEWIATLSPREQRRLANAAAAVATADTFGRRLVIKIEVSRPDGTMHFEELTASCAAEAESVVFEGTISLTAQNATLLARLRLLDAVMSSANDAIMITEAEPLDVPGPRILFVNEAARRQTGYTAEQMIGRSPRMLQGPRTDREATRRLGETLRQWKPASAQLLNYRADNSTFHIDLGITPVADEYGWWTHWISIQRDETERRSAADKLAYQAVHDSLTGLANRRLVASSFDALIKGSASHGGTYGVLQVDLDRFKSINDTFGHAAGDAVLIETAQRLRACSRPGDIVARIGGDEFLIVMPGLEDEDILAAAERLRLAVTGRFQWNDLELQIRASVGVASYPQDADDLEGLMVAADVALYKAKQQGRGCVGVFNPVLREEVEAVRNLGAALRVAFERGEFEPFFQPQVRVSDGRVVGLEALARWRHPRHGLLSPDVFLAAAGQAGLMAELDDVMGERVLAAAARWKEAGLEFGRVGLNVSSETFANPRLVPSLARRLAEHDISPDLVAVEMVESVFIDKDTKDVIDKLAALRGLGVSVDLDDFGTGYAALVHLRKFQIDRIKIDRSFILEIGKDSDNEVILSAIVKLAQNLGLRCIAEGVETLEQLDFLRGVGCEEVQGYYFGKPMSEHAMTDWLRRRGPRDSELDRGYVEAIHETLVS
jgi:diguanylate cyclase (GGDEF)-like protein/PAS domain S-box-containing protein